MVRRILGQRNAQTSDRTFDRTLDRSFNRTVSRTVSRTLDYDPKTAILIIQAGRIPVTLLPQI